MLYENGEGVEQDLALAYMYYALAAEQKFAGANKAAGLVLTKMTRDQVIEAHRMLDEWRARH